MFWYCTSMTFLQRWLAMRQMRFEGGFQGRTNKLVDGCYSFWQAGVFPLVHSILTKQEDTALSMDSWMFDQSKWQEWDIRMWFSPPPPQTHNTLKKKKKQEPVRTIFVLLCKILVLNLKHYKFKELKFLSALHIFCGSMIQWECL